MPPKPVTIYTTDFCPYCNRAKDLLKQKGIPFKEVNVTHNSKLRDELEEKTGMMTVPMIFIDDECIGGSDELHVLEASGELDKKLK